MTRPIVIGFLGRAGSGKSTASTYVAETYCAQRMSFARPLKELAKILWEFSDEQVYGSQAQKEAIDPRWGISPRTAMIRLGDGGRNALGLRVWVDSCLNKILEDAYERNARPLRPDEIRTRPMYLIEDVRYTNEVEAIAMDTRFHGFVIKLECPDSDSSSAYANAPSERSVDEVPAHLLHSIIWSKKSPGAVDLVEKVSNVMAGIVRRIDAIDVEP